MSQEWYQVCKDCRETFGYSDTSYQVGIEKGFSRPERCPEHREQHSKEIKSLASSHFKLVPKKGPRSILGTSYLGHVDHGKRGLASREIEPDPSGMDLGLTDNHVREVYAALEEHEQHQVLVLVAPTGSGKSTKIPYRLLDPLPGYKKSHFTKHGPIIVTQPRIAATRGIPNTIAGKMYGCSVGPGFEIGFRHGEGSRKGTKDGHQYDESRNRIIFVTDGSLLNWLAEGKAGDYSIVIIDEAHERSCTIDLILGLMKRDLLKYPYLRLIVLSATIDANRFQDYFSETTSVWLRNFEECEKTCGYELYWWEGAPIAEENMPEKVAEKVIELIKTTSDDGGILAFLPGKEQIETAVDLVARQCDGKTVRVFPLYAAIGTTEIDQARAPLAKVKRGNGWITPRRVVIATNIAETSITFPDVVYVVDSGLIKQTDWNPATCRQEFITRWHSQAGCKQRWGRVGRNRPGKVYTLYKEERFNELEEHTPPAITRECLDEVVLKAKVAGINDISQFSWLEDPPEAEMNRALSVVQKRQIVDTDGDLTEQGRELYYLAQAVSGLLDKSDYNSTQRSLDVATLLQLADRYACLVEATTVLAMMPHMGNSLYWKDDGLLQWDRRWDLKSKDHIGRIHQSLKAGCVDDLDLAIKLFALYERQLPWFWDFLPLDWPVRHFINTQSFALVNDAREALLECFTKGKKDTAIRPLQLSLIPRVRLLMAVAWPDRIVSLQPGDPVTFGAPYLKDDGIVSRYSCGHWSQESHAVVAMMDRGHIFTRGELRPCPVANFLVQLPKDISTSRDPIKLAEAMAALRSEFDEGRVKAKMFSDQYIPVGSTVEVTSKKDSIRIQSIVQLPGKATPVITGLEDDTDEESGSTHDLYEHRAAKSELKYGGEPQRGHDTIEPYQKDMAGGIVTYPYPGSWLSEIRDTRATVMSWMSDSGKTVAGLDAITQEPMYEGMQIGSKIKVTPISPIHDQDNGQLAGFIVKGPTGGQLPVPIAELSIGLRNPGLERLVGKPIEMTVAEQPSQLGKVILTLLPDIESDLERIIKEDEIEGRVAAIESRKSQDQVTVGIKGKGEIIHTATTPLDKLPAQITETLEIGGWVLLKIQRMLAFSESKASAFVRNANNLKQPERAVLRKHGIEVEGDYIRCATPLSYGTFLDLKKALPKLTDALRRLYGNSQQLIVKILETQKTYHTYQLLYSQACKIRDEDGYTDPATTKGRIQRLREEIHLKQISTASSSKINVVLNEAWKAQKRTSALQFITRLEQENDKLREWCARSRNPMKVAEWQGYIRENERKIREAR